MNFYDKQGTLLLETEVDDNSYRNRVIMGEHALTLYFSLAQHVELPIGTWCEFQGEVYTLMRSGQLKMQHTRQYDYTVTMTSEGEKAKIWKFRNPVDGRLRFSLTATPREHLQMFVDNMNRRDPQQGWEIGTCIDNAEKLITYDHDYCMDALTKQASEFETEFEIAGKRVSLHKVEYNKSNPLDLAYGKGKGLKPGVGRSNSSDTPAVEILYVQGGDRNIDRSKYPDPADEQLRASANGCLLLPCGQTIAYDGEHFEDEEGFNAASARRYIVDDLGLSIRNLDHTPTTLTEDSFDGSEYYPKRVGTVSSVTCKNPDKHFYDFIDESIPSDLDYKECQTEGETLSIIFQSGELAGREFDVNYTHKDRRFEIIPQEIDGILMPGDSFIPRQGNEYAVFGCLVPAAYIRNDATRSGASWDMFRAAVRYMFDNEEQRLTFSGELDGIWAKRDWDNIGGRLLPGSYVRFTDPQIAPDGALVRITAIKQSINNPHAPKVELSNEPVSTSVSATIKQFEATEATAENLHREALQFTKRRWRDAKETIALLQGAQQSLATRFTDSISPIAVETMSLLVGDKALQFRFVTNRERPQTKAHNVTWNNATKTLHADAGVVQHMTLGIDSIRSAHNADEYTYWDAQSFDSARIDDSEPRYLYLCTEPTGLAFFLLSKESRPFEDNVNYYLLVGVLNSEYDGDRSFVPLYGFTEILPGQITADRLLASDGESYFDMANAALKLKDKLMFNVDGSGDLRFKGCMVQSKGGDVAPMGCYRGSYNDETTYYPGDEVTYTIDGSTSTYRFVASEPATGIAPTSSLHWQILALGANGKDGTSFNPKGTANFHVGTIEVLPILKGTTLIDKHERIMQSAFTGEIVDKSIYCVVLIRDSELNIASSKSAEIGDAYILESTGELYVADGEKWVNCGVIRGEQGKAGAAAVFRGDYNQTTKYVGTDIRKDVVKYNDQYWIAKNVSKEFSGQPPTSTSEYWEPFGASFESVATGLLLAEEANIANLIFRNQRLESFDPHANGEPNFYIDGKNNIAAFDGGNVMFTRDKANIGWLEVVVDKLIGYEETNERLVITPDRLPDWNVKQEVDAIQPTNLESHMPGVLATGSEYAALNGMGIKSFISGTLEQSADISYSFQFQLNVENPNVVLYIDENEISFKSTGNYSDMNDDGYKPKVTATVNRGTEKIGEFELNEFSGEIYLKAADIYTVSIQVTIDSIPHEWSGEATCNLKGIYVTRPVSKTFIASDGIMTVYNANYIRLHAKEGITTRVNK